MSCQEMAELGHKLPPEDLDKEWDSNVITPGTRFMSHLSDYIKFYITERINTNSAWQGIKVIFSDHSDPGEGEHKIMDFIRRERSSVSCDMWLSW